MCVFSSCAPWTCKSRKFAHLRLLDLCNFFLYLTYLISDLFCRLCLVYLYTSCENIKLDRFVCVLWQDNVRLYSFCLKFGGVSLCHVSLILFKTCVNIYVHKSKKSLYLIRQHLFYRRATFVIVLLLLLLLLIFR